MTDPLKPEEIYNEIVKLLSDNNLYQQKKALGFKNAERFTWENAARKTEEIYDELSV